MFIVQFHYKTVASLAYTFCKKMSHFNIRDPTLTMDKQSDIALTVMDIIQDYLYFNKENHYIFILNKHCLSLICNFLRHEINPILDKVLTELDCSTTEPDPRTVLLK